MTHHDRDWRTADPTHAIWSSSEPVGRTDCPPASAVSGSRRLLASQEAHAPSTTEHATAGTSDTTDCPIWSSGEFVSRAASLLASLVDGRRQSLPRLGAPATLPARRTSTTAGDAHYPGDPAAWVGCESTGRAPIRSLRVSRWWSIPLSVLTKREYRLRANQSTTANGHTGRERVTTTAHNEECEHVTTSTRTEGGVA